MAAALLTIRLRQADGTIKAYAGYASDANDVNVTFDESKTPVAGSSGELIVKRPCTLVDVCFTSDLATPTNIAIKRNGTPTGDILDVTAQLASVVNRPNCNIPFAANDKLSITQLA